MIRPATVDDIPAVMALGEVFFREAGWPAIAEWHPPSVATFLEGLITGKVDGGVILAERQGEVVGITGFVCFPFYFNFAVRVAQEIFWYAQPEHRRGAGAAMLDEFERVAKDRGATILVMSAVNGLRNEALARLYRRRGYAPGESTFMKRVSP